MNGNRRPNQVLGLVDDLSNHPLALFVAEGLPVVVAPDDPGFWGAVGLSDDWTLALLAAAGRCGAMRLAKQLAINSLEHSLLAPAAREAQLAQWQPRWRRYVQWLLAAGAA